MWRSPRRNPSLCLRQIKHQPNPVRALGDGYCASLILGLCHVVACSKTDDTKLENLEARIAHLEKQVTQSPQPTEPPTPSLLSGESAEFTSAERGESPLENVNKPEWVKLGSRIVGDTFWGVGSVSGISNRSLAVATADNRARAEIAKLVQTPDNQALGLTQQALAGVQIVEHWISKEGTVYALAQLGHP